RTRGVESTMLRIRRHSTARRIRPDPAPSRRGLETSLVRTRDLEDLARPGGRPGDKPPLDGRQGVPAGPGGSITLAEASGLSAWRRRAGFRAGEIGSLGG